MEKIRNLLYKLKRFYFENGIFGYSSFLITLALLLSLISGYFVYSNQKIAKEVRSANIESKGKTYETVNKYKGNVEGYLKEYTGLESGQLKIQLKNLGTSIEKINEKTKNVKSDGDFWKIVNPIGKEINKSIFESDKSKEESKSGLKFVDVYSTPLLKIDKPTLFLKINPSNESELEIAKKWLDVKDIEVRIYNDSIELSSQMFLEGLYFDIVPGDQGNRTKEGYGNSYNNIPTSKDKAYFIKDGNLYGKRYLSYDELKDYKFPEKSIQNEVIK